MKQGGQKTTALSLPTSFAVVCSHFQPGSALSCRAIACGCRAGSAPTVPVTRLLNQLWARWSSTEMVQHVLVIFLYGWKHPEVSGRLACLLLVEHGCQEADQL